MPIKPKEIKEQKVQKIDFQKLVKTLSKNKDHEDAKLIKDLGDAPFWLSTGDDILDLYISNRKHGGIPGGRITELSGLPGSGKSLVCSHLIKSCQDMGGIPVLIQTQAATSLPFLQAIGVDLNKLIHYRFQTVQKIHKVTEQLMYSVKLQMPDVPMLIVVDSLTAATTQAQLKNTDYQNKGYNAALKARMNSQAFSKLTMMAAQQKVALVYTTQVRANMNMANPFVDPYETSSGGMALPFYASIRIRLHRSSKLKQNIHGVQTVVGSTVRARIDKSRLGATFRQCTFDVYYDCGINNYTNWLATLKTYNAIQGKGTVNLPWIVKHQGKQINLGKDFYKQIRNNQEIRDKIYDVIADLLILKYKKVQETDNRQITSEPDQGMTVDQ